MSPHHFFALAELVPWLVLVFYWIAMWNKAKPIAASHPDPWSNLNRALMVISIVMMGTHRLDIGFLGYNILPHSLAKALTGLALTWAGVLWAIWARAILAGNWNPQPSIQQNHQLVIEGPYKLTRHPIYTGILLAVLGTAIMVGNVRAFIALAIAFFGLWHKIRFEEDLMRRQFGRQYDDYAQRVKKLVPWVY